VLMCNGHTIVDLVHHSLTAEWRLAWQACWPAYDQLRTDAMQQAHLIPRADSDPPRRRLVRCRRAVYR